LLARHAGVPVRDVGYAGLKDRHAITRQWFSVRRPGGSGTDWSPFDQSGVRILDSGRNRRKLKRGANRGNRFRIAVRGKNADSDAIAARLDKIRTHGVPNYFGAQRFGRDGGNLQLARDLFSGNRMRRDKRSIALSAARAFLFNEILHSRVSGGTWNNAVPGEALNLDGSGSIFVADEIDDELKRRIAELDVHPTGAMWGKGELCAGKQAAIVDRRVADGHTELSGGLERAGVAMARRALRLVVKDLDWEIDDAGLWLEFGLGRGCYATAVLRELLE
jgi:tRNA pseudouridine13 synthase